VREPKARGEGGPWGLINKKEIKLCM